jgi:hypothetical protein
MAQPQGNTIAEYKTDVNQRSLVFAIVFPEVLAASAANEVDAQHAEPTDEVRGALQL